MARVIEKFHVKKKVLRNKRYRYFIIKALLLIT